MIADYLKIPVEQLREKYLKSVGFRTSIIEDPQTKDCIFLQEIAGKKGCLIYPVRPNQCRTWPFWNDNLHSEYTWNRAAMKCPGVNKGAKYSCEHIEKLRKQKKWYNSDESKTST
jgi:Fe-S-cluster containining protein